MENYEKIKQIGKGGSSTCYLVRDKLTNENFVCKIADSSSEGLDDKDVFFLLNNLV